MQVYWGLRIIIKSVETYKKKMPINVKKYCESCKIQTGEYYCEQCSNSIQYGYTITSSEKCQQCSQLCKICLYREEEEEEIQLRSLIFHNMIACTLNVAINHKQIHQFIIILIQKLYNIARMEIEIKN